ncbi:COMM domain-containing protein 3 [Dermacentor variabilis]|uniref:COMM domain-containing protein 3 n=1 Tax=Dermacentor variabilis TaxID=34621 RepID=UPI003F5AFCBD
MELAEAFVNGIAKAADPRKVSDADYAKLLDKVFSVVTNGCEPGAGGVDDDDESATADDDFKDGCAGLIALVLESSRFNLDDSQLALRLEEYGMTGARADTLVRKYAANKQLVRVELSRIGRRPPHVTGVDWSVDYRVKSNHLERIGEPVFHIELKTSTENPVSFACNMAQMQDLLHGLRDAAKCVENKAQGGGS